VEPGEGYCELLGGINRGVGGETSLQGLSRFKQDVLPHNPKMVIIEFGINDSLKGVSVADYRHALRKMVRLVKHKKVIIITPNPWFHDYSLNIALTPYVVAAKKVAKQEKVILVDNWTRFAILSLSKHLSEYYADYIHPNAEGHQAIYLNVLKRIK